MSERTKVVIADDHGVIQEGIKAALAGHPEFEVCGCASDGIQAVELVKSLAPDIVILDISMPRLSGLKAAREIRRINDKIRIVVFTMHGDSEYVLSLFQMGVSGYVLKECPLSELICALKAVRRGDLYFCGQVQEILPRCVAC
ncbi:MAG: response regulator transcription factor [Thermodesulfobacteriota bacterium]